MRIPAIVAVLLASAAFAAEPAKPASPSAAAAAADAVLARYDTASKAADKAAQEAREKAIKAPREAAIKELQAILASAMKAGDLATSNKINEKLAELKDDKPAESSPAGIAAKFLGKWSGTTTVTADGKIRHESGRTATWTVHGNRVIIKWADGRIEPGEFVDTIQTYNQDGTPRAVWTRTKGQ